MGEGVMVERARRADQGLHRQARGDLRAGDGAAHDARDPARRGADGRRHRGAAGGGQARPSPATGRFDYVCVSCGNVLAAAMDPLVHDEEGPRPLRALPDGQRLARGRRVTTDHVPPTRPIGFGRAHAQGGRALHPRPGHASSTTSRSRDAPRRGAAQPARARPDRLDRRLARRSQHPKVHAVHHRPDLEARGMAWMPTLSGDVPGRARHRQGPLPGAGGGVRGRRRPLLRRATRSS